MGAVLVKDRRILATGYNGAPTGLPQCDEVGCEVYAGHCTRAVHAELNALLQCARFGVAAQGAVLYTSHAPCVDCAKSLVMAAISEVHYKQGYADNRGEPLLLLQGAGVAVFPAATSSFSSEGEP